MGSAKPLVASGSIDTGKRLGDTIRERNVINRETIKVKSFMVEGWLCHHASFEYEYEYEYRCTEYEYDCPEERPSSRGGHV